SPQPNILVLDVSHHPPPTTTTSTNDLKITHAIPQKDLPGQRAEYIKAASEHATTIVADYTRRNKSTALFQ
ncbi:UPF0261 domain protein, partial [Aspergillus arachidicola]